MTPPDKYGKRRQITFRIGPIAEDRLRQVAALFNMKPSEYAKAVLYRDLAVFNEPLDQRRRSWRRKTANAAAAETDAETDEETESACQELLPGRGTVFHKGSQRGAENR